RSSASQLISNAPTLDSLINNSISRKILDYLRDYGLLLEFIPIDADPLRPEEPTYQFAFEPLNDYLIAENAVRAIIRSRSNNLPPGLKGKPAAQSWASLILLSDYKILVGEDNFWVNDLPEEAIDELRLFSLSQVNREDLNKFKPWVEVKIRESMPTSRKFINGLIVKVARIDNHPLGPEFLHEVLMSFENVAARDLIFSGPDFLLSNSDAVWGGWGQNPIYNQKLIASDLASGMPLLFAWTLTSVDEKLRHTCRKELTRWGEKNPQEFLKLLQLAFQSDDPQMREDIVQVSSAIACLLDPKDKILKTFAEWALDEIFRSEKIGVIRDIVIRQAGRIVCERAFLGGHISLKQVKRARPPFSITSSQYPVDRHGILKNEEHSVPISWDLAEYVLPRAYKGFFKEVQKKGQVKTQAESEWSNVSYDTIQEILSGKFGRISIKKRRELEAILEEKRLRKEALSEVQIHIINATPEGASESNRCKQKKEIRYSRNAEKLLRKYSEILEVKDVSPRQLTTAACFYYLNKMGWNKKEFYGEPNGGKSGEILGADVAIIREYGPASHGERSSVSSFAEKYVWCFVPEFIGYLADTLEYSEDHPEKRYFVSDYSHIYNLPPNPAQELHEVELDLNREDCGFFLPNNLAPEMKFRGKNRLNNLKRWITGAPIPDLSPWILPTKEHLNQINCFSNNPWLALQLFTSITEPTVQGSSLLWINSFIISNKEFKLFKRDCSLKAAHSRSFVESAISSYGHLEIAATYLTPFDVLWMPWKEECLEETHFSFQNNRQKQYKTYHTTVEGYYRSAISGERGYVLPSKIIREFLEICKGDELKYYSLEDSLKGFYFESGIRWRDGQKMIFVRRDELLRKLKEKNYSIFWTIRLSRRPSMHALEEFPDMRVEKDMHWVFWVEGTRTKLLEISQSISS
ncbi:MAG: hypothetical protein PHG06_22900, partial [Parabacteroides sp.]|nr:hypothetical protein [Parabacteroides sp.]